MSESTRPRSPGAAARVDPRHHGQESSLPALVDSVLQARNLCDAAAAACAWWCEQYPAAKVAVGVVDDRRKTTYIAIASASTDRSVGVEHVDDCLLTADESLGDQLAHALSSDDCSEWQGLAENGESFGGILIAGSRESSGPPEAWLNVTTSLLVEIRRRDHQLLIEKLASLAEFAAGAGHEINNPLGSILGRVQMLAREESHPERQRMFATIGAQALRVRDMISDAMLFARPPAPQPKPLDAAQAIDDVVARFSHDSSLRDVTITGDRDPTLEVSADPAQFRIVVSELLRNSLHAAPYSSSIEMTLCPRETRVGRVAELTMHDQGPGLSEADHRHLFDPFYSGRQAGRGLGFGLSKCWRIVTGHGGCIHAENSDPGVRMTVHWPLS